MTVFLLPCASAFAHGVAEGDKGYIQEITGVQLLPFVYLGAKHMVTGYDHLLFLFGVIFFMYRLQHVALYVSLFAFGHSTTLLAGVYFGMNVSSYLIDTIIGLSVVYKALDNLGPSSAGSGSSPTLSLLRWCSASSTVRPGQLAFKVGVEIGQLLALAAILIAMGFWRRSGSFGQSQPLNQGLRVQVSATPGFGDDPKARRHGRQALHRRRLGLAW